MSRRMRVVLALSAMALALAGCAEKPTVPSSAQTHQAQAEVPSYNFTIQPGQGQTTYWVTINQVLTYDQYEAITSELADGASGLGEDDDQGYIVQFRCGLNYVASARFAFTPEGQARVGLDRTQPMAVERQERARCS